MAKNQKYAPPGRTKEQESYIADGKEDSLVPARDEDPKKQVTFYMPESVHKRIKIQAAIHDETMSDLITQAVKRYLEVLEEG